jgi:hypothetical protein
MLPLSHIAYTWGAFSLLGKRCPSLRTADYRLVALTSLLPDLIDKPLAVFVLPKQQATVLFSHSLVANVIALTATLLWFRRLLPYTLALLGHLVLDRMWDFPKTFWWPFRGRNFQRWKYVGSVQDFGRAYVQLMPEHPELVGLEAGGLLVLGWLVARHGLHRRENLARFLRTGRL